MSELKYIWLLTVRFAADYPYPERTALIGAYIDPHEAKKKADELVLAYDGTKAPGILGYNIDSIDVLG